MTREEMAEVLETLQEEENRLREAGQKEYAHDEDNAFRNFEALSADLGIPREKVLWIFLKKHLDGILAHINGHRSQREAVRGRILDARVYLALLAGMDEEDRAERGREAFRESFDVPKIEAGSGVVVSKDPMKRPPLHNLPGDRP